jgi:hypothetical protein
MIGAFMDHVRKGIISNVVYERQLTVLGSLLYRCERCCLGDLLDSM